MNWSDISLDKYLKMRDIIEDEGLNEIEKNIELVELLYGVDDSITLVKFNQLGAGLTFLGEDIPHCKVKKKYKINGVNYVRTDISEMSVAQFQDFTNYQKNNDLMGMMGAILVPDKHKYNDGYEKDNLLNMSIVDVVSLLHFFVKCSQTFTSLIREYIQLTMKRIMKSRRVSKEKKERLQEQINILENLGGYSLW